jgi:multidrug resistance efflux pump
MPPRRHSPKDRIHAVAVLVALVGVAGILVFFMLGSGVTVLRAPGVVQSTEIKIAPEISGRLARLAVAQGQSVRQGEDLAELANPELSASLVLASAEAGEARAARDRVYAGIRAEQVAILAREIETDRSNLLFAEQQFARKSILAADGFAPRQDLDEATAAVGAARAKLAAAQETYQAAHLGPTREELAIADARVENANAAVEVIAARVAKLRLRAPADGIVAVIVAEPGEAVVPGQPVMTLEATGRQWVSFNLREDQFDGLRIGSPIELMPVGSENSVKARVAEIIARGEFATWRAARVVGDHDLNTFLIRLDPITPTSEVLQAGMSISLRPAAHNVQ